LTDRLFQALAALPHWLIVVLLSAAPVSEVRGGIPVGLLALKMSPAAVLPLAFLSCTLAAVPVVLLFNWAAGWFQDKPVLGPLVRWVVHHARQKRKWGERYGVLAITIFVALPVPGFGVWTGAPLAAIFGMRFWPVMACMALGVAIQCALVLAATYAGLGVFLSFHG
jgi:uncharacterized membrane protein